MDVVDDDPLFVDVNYNIESLFPEVNSEILESEALNPENRIMIITNYNGLIEMTTVKLKYMKYVAAYRNHILSNINIIKGIDRPIKKHKIIFDISHFIKPCRMWWVKEVIQYVHDYYQLLFDRDREIEQRKSEHLNKCKLSGINVKKAAEDWNRIKKRIHFKYENEQKPYNKSNYLLDIVWDNVRSDNNFHVDQQDDETEDQYENRVIDEKRLINDAGIQEITDFIKVVNFLCMGNFRM